MRIIRVKCQGEPGDRCEKAYEGCKERVMYSYSDRKVTCDDGDVKVKA